MPSKVVLAEEVVESSGGDLLVRRLFLSGLGVVYGIAFVSLWVQIHGLVGSHGILSAAEFVEAAGRSLGASRWWRVPTIAWLTGASDAALHALCAAGTLVSALLAVGVAPAVMALLAWVLYLSLLGICRDFLSFQWDILLLEAGFLAVFYAPPLAWTARSRAWRAPPSTAVTWLLRLLIAKLMFLSGVVKLSGGDPTWRDLTALSYHYETTCLPTWTGWWMHQLPLALHKVSVLLMYATELALPFSVLGPRRLRAVAAAGFTGLMLFVGATGNYGFFNVLSIMLCLPLLDDAMIPARWRAHAAAFVPELNPALEAARRPRRGWPVVIIGLLAALILLLTPVSVARAFRFAVAWPQPIALLSEWQAPFHLVNGYGLFANMTTERPEIIVEGSDDGQSWRAYEFRWKPGDPARRPEFVQPHMPRLDWQMWFAALGSYQTSRWFLPFCRRLLEGSPAVLDLLGYDPFAEAPPRYLRATLYDYRFTTREQRRETGAWWRRRPIGPYIPTIYLSREEPQGLRAVR